MKAILVIDLPNDANPAHYNAKVRVEPYILYGKDGNIAYKEPIIKEFYGLKPIPNKIDWLENGYSAEWVLFSTGWNACLEEIQK